MATYTSNELGLTPTVGSAVVLAGTAGNNRCDLSWNDLAGATSQRVYRKTASLGYQQIGTVPPGSHIFADTKGMNPTTSSMDPNNGTLYTYKVEVDAP